jgi:hypothetical protein
MYQQSQTVIFFVTVSFHLHPRVIRFSTLKSKFEALLSNYFSPRSFLIMKKGKYKKGLGNAHPALCSTVLYAYVYICICIYLKSESVLLIFYTFASFSHFSPISLQLATDRSIYRKNQYYLRRTRSAFYRRTV